MVVIIMVACIIATLKYNISAIESEQIYNIIQKYLTTGNDITRVQIQGYNVMQSNGKLVFVILSLNEFKNMNYNGLPPYRNITKKKYSVCGSKCAAMIALLWSLLIVKPNKIFEWINIIKREQKKHPTQFPKMCDIYSDEGRKVICSKQGYVESTTNIWEYWSSRKTSKSSQIKKGKWGKYLKKKSTTAKRNRKI